MCTLAFPLPLCTAHAHTYTVIHMHARHIDIAMHSGFNLYHNGNRDLFERPKNGKAHSVFCDEADTGVGSAFLYICRAMAHFTNPNPFARPNPSAQPTQEDSTESMTVFCRPSTTRTVQRICLALPSAPFQHKFCKRSRKIEDLTDSANAAVRKEDLAPHNATSGESARAKADIQMHLRRRRRSFRTSRICRSFHEAAGVP